METKILEFIRQHGWVEGDMHKAWVIDQLVRILTGCPIVTKTEGGYEHKAHGESAEYLKWVADYENGEEGPKTYEWDIGAAP